jgi:hypothetical protein
MTELAGSFDTLMSVVTRAEAKGYERMEDGTQLFGRLPQLGSEAWLHVLYSPLDSVAIGELQSQIRHIPDCYQGTSPGVV